MMRLTGTMAAMAACAALAAAAQAPQGDAARGQALFMKDMCYTCHGTAGQGGDRGSGPRLTPGLFPWEGFQQQVRHPRAVMPRYATQFVSDQDLADIYAYLASIKSGPSAKDIPLLRE
ncbi:MAG: c-type cytochrome [Betaproteobacteria bacterium]